MSNTPETDNLARGNRVVPTELAKQLERERNEALVDKSNGDTVTITINHYDCIISKLDNARREADYYKAKYESVKE